MPPQRQPSGPPRRAQYLTDPRGPRLDRRNAILGPDPAALPPDPDAERLRRLAVWNATAATHDMRQRDRRCELCGALHWVQERVSDSSQINPKFAKCCGKGRVELPPIGGDTERMRVLHELFVGDGPRSQDFRGNIRKYNNAFAFTSIGMKRDRQTEGQMGLFILRTVGRVAHLITPLLPEGAYPHRFSQIYLLDTEREIETRLQHHMIRQQDTVIGFHLDLQIVRDLQHFFQGNNYYAGAYRTAHQMYLENPIVDAITIRQVPGGPNPRRYNMPHNTSEIAMVIAGNDETAANGRNITVHRKDRRNLTPVSELHRTFLPMHFPIIHPFGEDGWYFGIPLVGEPWVPRRGDEGLELHDDGDDEEENQNDGKLRNVTLLRWIRYHIHDRARGEGTRLVRPFNAPVFSALLSAGSLFQEYIIDVWAQIEQCRLRFIENNQTQLRADTYRGIGDAANAGLRPEDVGTPVILPSTFIGGARNMQQLFQDAMNIVRHLGNPSFFITMTYNPNWPEIRQELLPHQKPTDRPDIVARVFHEKLRSLIYDLEKKAIFGRVLGRVHTIEFQKRGLPHAHLLLIMALDDRPRTAEHVDAIVSAELPDPDADPVLFEIVSRSMLHGPCNKRCQKQPGAPCEKRFPK